MNWASSELVSLLIFLLPGLVAVGIFSSLTSSAKPSDFDRVFQSLIFTTLVQAITAGILWGFGREDVLNFLENGHVELLVSVGKGYFARCASFLLFLTTTWGTDIFAPLVLPEQHLTLPGIHPSSVMMGPMWYYI